LSKLMISAIAHLHTVGLKGFVTLLGEKGFPPPNGFTLIMASLRSEWQRVSEAYSRLEIGASERRRLGMRAGAENRPCYVHLYGPFTV
jgi:hypothetical protein